MDENQTTATNTTKTRSDGRVGSKTLRPLSCEISCLQRADGSAKLKCGYTEILVAVYGPIAPRNVSRENPKQAVVSVVFKHTTKGLAGGATATSVSTAGYGATEREIERFIGEALLSSILVENFPRTVIEIVLQVIQADGSVLGTALNASVLALMDAGIPMNFLPIATTCLVVKTNDPENNSEEIDLDPCADEETPNQKQPQYQGSVCYGNY